MSVKKRCPSFWKITSKKLIKKINQLLLVKILQAGAKVSKIAKNKIQNEQNLKFFKFDFQPHNFKYNHFFHLKFGTIVTCNVSKKMVGKNSKIATNSCDEVTNYVKIMQKTVKIRAYLYINICENQNNDFCYVFFRL